ncbi:GAF domain-containing protein [bacterium]|nr:GAF domain-containing protein [bacterium]
MKSTTLPSSGIFKSHQKVSKLVVTEGIRSTNPNAESLFEQITSSRTTYRRLVAGILLTTVLSIAAKMVLPAGYLNALGNSSTLMLAAGACVGFAGATYLLARFVLNCELRHLILASAFITIAEGHALQIILDIRMPGSLSAGWVSSAAWTISGILFACSAYVNTTCKTGTRRSALVQSLLVCLLVLVGPLIAVPYVIDGPLNTYISTMEQGSVPFLAAGMLTRLAAVVLYLVTLIGFFRRTYTNNDRMAGMICFAFIPLIVSLAFRMVSTTRFDDWSIISLILESLSWLAIMCGFCIQNAIMQREAQDRLQELDALHQVSWSVVGTGTLHDLLDLYARTHQEQLGVKVAAVYLVDETGYNLELYALRGPADCPGAIGKKYPVMSENRWPGFHTGHTAKAFLTKEVQVANDVFVDVEFIPWRMVASDDGCAVSLPLVVRNNSIGVVNLYFEDCKLLTRQRLRLLSIIAGAAAPAIASAMEKKNNQEPELGIAA